MPAPPYLNTANRIIRLALKDAGRLQTGDEPSGEVYADALARLGDLVNAWQTQGLKLWLNATQSITLTAGVGSYTLGPGGAIVAAKPLRVINGWYVRTDGSRREMGLPVSWTDFRSLGTLSQQGEVTAYHVDKQQNNLVVQFWLVPSASAAAGGAVELLVQRPVTTPISLLDDLGFPVEWYLALRWGLADELATGQPALIMDRCERKAREFRQMLEEWDVEDSSTRFAMEPSGAGRRF